MRLSETTEAQVWLSQFTDADKPTAQRLLDDLTIVTPTLFTVRMRELVHQAIGVGRKAVALYPVWEVEPAVVEDGKVVYPGESIFPLDLPCGPRVLVNGENPGAANKPDVQRRRSTIPDPIKPPSGSVGACIQLISAIQKERKNTLDRPACHVLHATKCQEILLLDDVMGSGKRVTDYLEAFYRHTTIKSWWSYKKLRITVVCYAATETALKSLETYRLQTGHTRPHPVKVLCDQLLFKGRSFWTVAERQQVEALCRKYAHRTSRPKIPLGFRNAFSMIAFPHGVPNTAPPILWAGKKGQWIPLFKDRGVPISLLKEFDQVQRDPAGERLPETLTRLKQLRLAGLDWSRYATPAYRELILLLGIVSRGFRSEKRIIDIMETQAVHYKRLLSIARKFGFVAPDGALTPEGVRELEYTRQMGISPWEAGPLNEEAFYFPQSLKPRVRQRFV